MSPGDGAMAWLTRNRVIDETHFMAGLTIAIHSYLIVSHYFHFLGSGSMIIITAATNGDAHCRYRRSAQEHRENRSTVSDFEFDHICT